MMKAVLLSQIHRMLSYNDWANKRLMEDVRKLAHEDYTKPLPIPFGSIEGLLQHLYYYDTKHYYRIVEKSSVPSMEKQIPKELLAESILQYSNKWLQWSNENVVSSIDMVTSEIDTVITKISEVSTHNTYHRGQVHIILAFLGYKPESLDVFRYNSLISE